MKNVPYHTVYLQDGTLCNFKKRIWRHAKTLISCFERIPDPRQKRGIRHNLPFILFILFGGITRKETTLTGCHLWSLNNKPFLKRYFSSIALHGIPDPTTISRVLQEMDPQEVAKAYLL